MSLTKEEYLLDCLIEECAEIIQRATKAKRFGLEEIQKDQSYSNEYRLIDELNDLVGVADLLFEDGWHDQDLVDLKKAKVSRYMQYSFELGVIK